MVLNQKPTGRASSMPKGLLAAGVSSLGITLLGAAVLAILVDKEFLEENKIGYGVMMILLIASYVGAIIAWRKIKHQRLVVCLSAGGIYFAILLSITALFFGGQYSAVGETALLVLCGSVLAVLTGLKNGSRKQHRIKSAYR